MLDRCLALRFKPPTTPFVHCNHSMVALETLQAVVDCYLLFILVYVHIKPVFVGILLPHLSTCRTPSVLSSVLLADCF